MDLTKSYKERGQDNKGEVTKPKFSSLNKHEPRLAGAQVHYHGVV
jgi:hypothetical protein